MWSARLPGGLVDQIVEAAEEEGVSQGELVEQAMSEWLDDREAASRRSSTSFHLADDAARSGLSRVEAFLEARGSWSEKLVVGCMVNEHGAVVGARSDPAELAADAVEFATIAAAAAGKQLTILTDGDTS